MTKREGILMAVFVVFICVFALSTARLSIKHTEQIAKLQRENFQQEFMLRAIMGLQMPLSGDPGRMTVRVHERKK